MVSNYRKEGKRGRGKGMGMEAGKEGHEKGNRERSTGSGDTSSSTDSSTFLTQVLLSSPILRIPHSSAHFLCYDFVYQSSNVKMHM